MAKVKISEFSSTPGNNTDIDGINIAEGCAPSGINDAIRELMAQLKDFQTGAAGDSFNGPVGTTTAAAGAFTTLSASGAVTLSGATANSVPYLNGSKVLTTGSALTFDGTNLALGGATNPSAYSRYFEIAGSDAALYVRDTDTAGAWGAVTQSGSNSYLLNNQGSWIFNASNAERMRLTSTGLGIGTSSPAYKLDVSAAGTTVSSAFRSDQSEMWMMLKDSGTTLGHVRLGSASGAMLFYSGNNTRATLDSSGNLGLGVIPSAWGALKAVQVGSGAAFSGGAAFNDAFMSANVYYDGANWKRIGTNSAAYYSVGALGTHIWNIAGSAAAGTTVSWTQAMTLDASGNLAVGTTNSAPANGTGMVVGSAGTIARIDMRNSTTGLASGDGTSFYLNGNDFTIENRETGFVAFATSSTERARIDSSGNLLVGTTSASARVTIRNATSADGLRLNQEGGTSLYVNNTNASYYAYFVYNGTNTGRIETSGTTTSYVTSSDYRLKNTIAPMTGALAKVAALKPVTYKWNADGSDGEGFIAHELAEVVPQCVTGEKDAVDADGNPVYQGIDTSFLVATLTAAIQEQQAIITALTARVEALEAA